MKLVTKELRKKLPPLYATQDQKDPLIICKFFYPDFSWTWFATEFDGADTFFGIVDGDFLEWGYFSLSELMATKGPMGLPVERDRYFTPCRSKELIAQLRKARGEHCSV